MGTLLSAFQKKCASVIRKGEAELLDFLLWHLHLDEVQACSQCDRFRSTTPAPTGLSLPLAANQGEASGLPTYLALAGLGPSRHALGYCLSSLPPVLFSLASNSDICLRPSPALGILPSFGFLVSFLPSPQCSFLLQCHQPW